MQDLYEGCQATFDPSTAAPAAWFSRRPAPPSKPCLQAVQDLYEECQATFDPNNVAALLQQHPYHLDALLTMHDLYRSMGEQAYAGARLRKACLEWAAAGCAVLDVGNACRPACIHGAVLGRERRQVLCSSHAPPAACHRAAEEMLERALYALEMAWHPSFSPAAAAAHVPYDDASAPLFICLFRCGRRCACCCCCRSRASAASAAADFNNRVPAGSAPHGSPTRPLRSALCRPARPPRPLHPGTRSR